jgi:hypothetical protein
MQSSKKSINRRERKEKAQKAAKVIISYFNSVFLCVFSGFPLCNNK